MIQVSPDIPAKHVIIKESEHWEALHFANRPECEGRVIDHRECKGIAYS
jgi:hypothetical protein